MVTVEEAAQLALALPEVTEGERHGTRTWDVAANPKGFFTIPHFDGYPAVLIQLKTVAKPTSTSRPSRRQPKSRRGSAHEGRNDAGRVR
jgi:hypothetical protein